MKISLLVRCTLALLLVLATAPAGTLPARAAGAASLTTFGATYGQDFDTLASSGTSAAVPTGWAFSESAANANSTYTAGTGSANAGDTYSFGAAGSPERAFGGLRSGSLVPLLGVQFTNDTGGAITTLAVSYTGEQWRLGQNTAGRAADRLDFQLSTDATSLVTGTWSDYDALDFASPALAGTTGALDGNLEANRAVLAFSITGLSIANGASFWLRWVDADLAPGADDGLAVDDFYLTPGGTHPLPVAIHDIQGHGHLSPLGGQLVQTSPAVVTALRTGGSTRGFYLQDPNPDGDRATSEGLFVFTGSSSDPAGQVAVGDAVQVTGRVAEYRPGGTSSPGLTVTELIAPLQIDRLSAGNPLPAPVVIGTGGLIPPDRVIEDDANGNVETASTFDPASDGIDFYESLEGMLVRVNDAVAVGPAADFGSNREIPVLGDNGANGGVRTSRGGIVVQADDFNPERIILNDWIGGGPVLPAADVGDAFPGATLGVVDYSFNNFKLQVIALPGRVRAGLAPETAPSAGSHQLSVAAFNVENLAPGDPPARFQMLAQLLAGNLRAPDLIAVEEVQDNDGVTDDGVVDASATWSALVAALHAASGLTYDYRQIDPVDNQDGGAPGGNIRVGFLFRTDRGLSFVDRPGAASTTANAVVGHGAATRLQYSPGRIDPTNPAFDRSRKPLAAEFMFNGQHLFAIANHWNSKGGDQPLFGANQPPASGSEIQRNEQAAVVHDFAHAILTADPGANVIVMGDLNDFQFSRALATLIGPQPILTDLIATLPLAERYTYVYEGNSEVLDHILVSGALAARPYVYDVVHVNSEFSSHASDHEPQALVITLDDLEPAAYLPILHSWNGEP